MGSLVLIRVATQSVDGVAQAHLHEFAAPTLEEAIEQAMTWNADRTNHQQTPSPNGWLIERWAGEEWVEVDLTE